MVKSSVTAYSERFRWTTTSAMALAFTVSLPCFAQNISEYQVKAAYLYNFAKGTEWPEQVLRPNSGLIFCVLGGDEGFVTVLRSALSGKSVNGHPLQVKHVDSGDGLRFCHVAFFRASTASTGATVRSLRNGNVLLVGEEPTFLSQGGMINFMPRDGKLSFEVSPEPKNSVLHYGVSSPAASRYAVESGGSRPLKSRVEPIYPDLAKKMKLTGSVQLQIVVAADGTVREVHVLGGHPVLAAAAKNATLEWRYQPSSKETTETARITFGQ